MSNFLAIATVTATVGELIRIAISRDVPGSVPGAVVTHVPVESMELDRNAPGVNVYLYDVRRNIGLTNNDLPTRNAKNGLLNRPQIALNLEYLLTFFGDDRRLEPQRLMGTVLSALHAEPALPRKLIRDTVRNYDYLASSNLADQIELVKFTDVSLSIDDFSKLWSVFLQGDYRLSHIFEATVVLIDEPVEPQAPLPVRTASVRAIPFRDPRITAVWADDPSTKAILPGDEVVVRGSNLAGEITRLALDANVFDPASVSEGEIRFRLDPDWLWLRPGISVLQVLQYARFGESARLTASSNSIAVPIHPRIALQKKEPVTNAIRLVFSIEPSLMPMQDVQLLLNAYEGPASYRINAEPRREISGEVWFVVPEQITGDFLVRIDVAGVQSLLELDQEQRYSNPRVTLP